MNMQNTEAGIVECQEDNLSSSIRRGGETEQLTYAEIFSNLLLNSEFHIIIAAENEKDVKVGLKNIKARQSSKLKEDGLPPSPEVLAFNSKPHPTILGAINLKITLKPVASVEVFGTYAPDNTF